MDISEGRKGRFSKEESYGSKAGVDIRAKVVVGATEAVMEVDVDVVDDKVEVDVEDVNNVDNDRDNFVFGVGVRDLK